MGVPNPYWGLSAYTDQSQAMSYLRQNLNDKPWLQLSTMSRAIVAPLNAMYFTGGTATAPAPSGAITNEKNVSPIVCGLGTRIGGTTTDFIIFAPTHPIGQTGHAIADYFPINTTQLFNVGYAVYAQRRHSAYVAIAYDSDSRGYQMGRKELTGTNITAGGTSRIYGADGDYIASTISSHVDLIFPFNQLILTSDDLQQVPEKTQDAGSRQPILSGYTLSTFVPTSVNQYGEPAGSTSTPFGTIYFSEGGQRRYHHLLKLSGPLRQFAINAAITYKDPKVDAREVVLHPGGQFTAQLLFIKKMEER